MIAVLAIVAAIAAPRFFSRAEFDERLFFDEVRAALGHAQKLAVASGCEVRVTLDASGYELRQRSSCTGPLFDRDVPHPAGTSPMYAGAPPGGVALASTVNPIVFDALGRARDGGGVVSDASVTVGSRLLAAVGQTGFVYAP